MKLSKLKNRFFLAIFFISSNVYLVTGWVGSGLRGPGFTSCSLQRLIVGCQELRTKCLRQLLFTFHHSWWTSRSVAFNVFIVFAIMKPQLQLICFKQLLWVLKSPPKMWPCLAKRKIAHNLFCSKPFLWTSFLRLGGKISFSRMTNLMTHKQTAFLQLRTWWPFQTTWKVFR